MTFTVGQLSGSTSRKMLVLADLLPGDIDNEGVIRTMVLVTAAVLFVVGVSIWFFARWSIREKRKREREIGVAVEFGDQLK